MEMVREVDLRTGSALEPIQESKLVPRYSQTLCHQRIMSIESRPEIPAGQKQRMLSVKVH
ncbi:hypothetical protein BJG92_01576 [Arthrobacter sp. SO5]|nr:hypothetical protein [Arthrobacter sp. SO5]